MQRNVRCWTHSQVTGAAVATLAVALSAPVLAQKKYDPGASDTEIKIGNTNPYSGPASAYGQIGIELRDRLDGVGVFPPGFFGQHLEAHALDSRRGAGKVFLDQ